mmetsp:Transcript_30638/g.64219  ORF Transcript_30638/g.64219 Transcript_30638/m.64219 type:complete len:150 (-) Transcript_30638:1140-1589(-)
MLSDKKHNSNKTTNNSERIDKQKIDRDFGLFLRSRHAPDCSIVLCHKFCINYSSLSRISRSQSYRIKQPQTRATGTPLSHTAWVRACPGLFRIALRCGGFSVRFASLRFASLFVWWGTGYCFVAAAAAAAAIVSSASTIFSETATAAVW